jgi:hypothetical protein
LVYIEAYRANYLINSHSDYIVFTSKDSGSDIVRLLISVSFDSRPCLSSFSYQNRAIATPFLSTVGLEDPTEDRRLLGNCVYCPGLNGFGFGRLVSSLLELEISAFMISALLHLVRIGNKKCFRSTR